VTRRVIKAAVAAAIAIGLAMPALAHGLLMKLDGAETALSGELYYSNGTRAAGEWIEVFGEAKPGIALHTIQTDAEGSFRAVGEPGHVYLVKATGEEGHSVEMRITLAPKARGETIETAAPEEGGLPAWAVIGGILLLSAIPALYLRRRKSG